MIPFLVLASGLSSEKLIKGEEKPSQNIFTGQYCESIGFQSNFYDMEPETYPRIINLAGFPWVWI